MNQRTVLFRVLVINPGSTSTKLALFENETAVVTENISHPHEAMARFNSISEQYEMRREAVHDFVRRQKIALESLSAVVARGGMLRPLAGGTYVINAKMLAELGSPHKEREHAVNLAAPLADELAAPAGLPSYVVDPVCVDEMDDVARVAGLPEYERKSTGHYLSLKSAAHRLADERGQQYDKLNLVVAHMGGGISVSAHRRGRIVDINQALDGTGPFSPERVGGLPVGDVLRSAFSGKCTFDELFARFTRRGGLLAHLGTNNALEVEERIAAGDQHASLVYEAMAYQIAKEIGLMATVLKGDVDAVVLTGGLARSSMLTSWIRERVEWIAPVTIYPGEDEMLSLATGALRVLRGQEAAKEY
jgi:butyrate kinase